MLYPEHHMPYYADSTLFGPISLRREPTSNIAAWNTDGSIVERLPAFRAAVSGESVPYTTTDVLLPWGCGTPLDTAATILVATGVKATRPGTLLFLVDHLVDLQQLDLDWRISAGTIREWAKTHADFDDFDRAFEYQTGRQGTCPICGKRQLKG